MDAGPSKDQSGLTILFSPRDNVYADPCGAIPMDPPVGVGVDAVAQALAKVPGVQATKPAPSSVGGIDATYLELTIPTDIGCSPSAFNLWSTGAEWMKPGMPNGGTDFYAERDHLRIWVLDMDGPRYLVATAYDSNATKAALAELQDVVDSITLSIPLREVMFGACTLDIQGVIRPPAGPPIELTLGSMDPNDFELRGPSPQELPLTPPLAQLDFYGEGWSDGRGTPGGAGLIPPAGSTHTGFVTSTTVNGFQGSFVFDTPGTWWIRISDGAGCFQQYPVQVLPAQGGPIAAVAFVSSSHPSALRRPACDPRRAGRRAPGSGRVGCPTPCWR